jgi:hypothetical protein
MTLPKSLGTPSFRGFSRKKCESIGDHEPQPSVALSPASQRAFFYQRRASGPPASKFVSNSGVSLAC